MAIQWYALHSKPNKEEALWRQLLNTGVESYYPYLRVRTVNPRARANRPYFPGYLFVHTDLDTTAVATYLWMHQSVGLVSFDGVPASVPDTLISSIRRTIDQITESGTQWYDELRPGDYVRIHAGPFSGYDAMFDRRLSASDRVRVLLELLSGQSVRVDLDAVQLEPTGRSYLSKR